MVNEDRLGALRALGAYEILESRQIDELGCLGVRLSHKKSGAALFLLLNDDENKVFSIAFRTPPDDSTGLPHILEHSVLEGSEKFPAKDPFVELVKGSLNTFLNAMTYPDKTVYPVASCNEKDFCNLMDVYLDGVFHPLIYREEKIFAQEGWHYELSSEQEPLTVNGVVYNEMKGAYSSPEGVLEDAIKSALFPDTCYAYDSGGDPEKIPELTFERFLDFHRTYYHPANSYIYLYGDVDMAERLNWLDKTYLSAFDKADFTADTRIALQTPFKAPVRKEISYNVSEEEGIRNKTYLSLGCCLGTALDPILYVALQILEYTLIDAPGAPLKKALIDAGIGQDVLGGCENGIFQPYFSVIAKNADEEQRGEFLAVVKGTLRKLAGQGINKKSLLAGLNYYEFRYREADYGSAPKGLMYGLWCLDSWLYGGDPMLHLRYQETFDFLKREAGNRYFEGLIERYLLDNPHEVVVVLRPDPGKAAADEAAFVDRMARFKASLSEAQVQELVEKTAALKAYQEEPSSQEALLSIPMLSREDIKKQAAPLSYEVKTLSGVNTVHTCLFTSGIAYVKLLFDLSCLPQEDLCYAAFLKSVLGYVDTERFTYADLASEIYLNSGGIDFSVACFCRPGKDDSFFGAFQARGKVLYEKTGFLFEIMEEILLHSKLRDEKRIREILDEALSRARMRIESGSHSAAVGRAASYYSAAGAFSDLTGGIGYFRFLEESAARFGADPAWRGQFTGKLREVAGRLFNGCNLLLSVTADESGYRRVARDFAPFKEALAAGEKVYFPFRFTPQKKNEGFTGASLVNYVARAGLFDPKEYTGAFKVLKVILNYDYLWMNLRVKGGAYGCMSGFSRFGEGYFVSYRDPNVSETNAIYEGVCEYVGGFDVDERDMTKYVIGAISDVDVPLTPSQKGSRSLSAYLTGLTDAMIQKERDEILQATKEDIRALARPLSELLSCKVICAIGNEEKIRRSGELFGVITGLYH